MAQILVFFSNGAGFTESLTKLSIIFFKRGGGGGGGGGAGFQKGSSMIETEQNWNWKSNLYSKMI